MAVKINLRFNRPVTVKFALGDPEEVKLNPLVQKKKFLQKILTFLQYNKTDGILTLIEVEIEGTFEGTP